MKIYHVRQNVFTDFLLTYKFFHFVVRKKNLLENVDNIFDKFPLSPRPSILFIACRGYQIQTLNIFLKF